MLNIAGWAHCTYCGCLKGCLEVEKKDLEAVLVSQQSVQDTSDKLLVQASLSFCLLIRSVPCTLHQRLSAACQGSGKAY